MNTSPTLIFIHGFRGTHHGLSLIAAHFSGHDAFVPDLPGFGDGPSSELYNLENYVAWLHGYITAHRGEKTVLIGHSFGSIVAAAFAAAHPQMIDRLVLINPIGAPALEGPRGILSKLAVGYYWVGKRLPARAGKAWLSSRASVQVMSSVMAKTKDKALRRYIHDQHHRYFSQFHSADSVYQGFLTSISHSVRDVAPKISTPTLLIAGEKDDITPIEKQKELLALFSHASMVVIPNVGHLTHYETPDQVAQAIQSFIKDV